LNSGDASWKIDEAYGDKEGFDLAAMSAAFVNDPCRCSASHRGGKQDFTLKSLIFPPKIL
jgi:hypothetical protein